MAVKLVTFPPVAVASGGVAVPLSNQSLLISSVTIQANFTNVSKLVVGDSSVLPNSGIEIPPGDTVTIEGVRQRVDLDELILSDIFINSSTSGDGCRIAGFKRRD